jgi:hypothetical protein
VEATWRPWELRLAIVRSTEVAKTGRGKSQAGLDKHRELLSVSTADARITTESGPIALYAVPYFLSSAVEVAVFWSQNGSAPPSPSERTTSEARGPQLAVDANVAADLPLPFANQVLRRLTGSQPLTIPVNRDEVDVQNVSASVSGSGESARLTVVGDASPRSMRETMHWTVAAAGEPLRVSLLRMSAELEDCAGLGTMAALACNARNGVRGTAADGFAAALTQKYQGQLVHELASPLDLRFTVAGQRLQLRGDLLRMKISPRGLSATAKLSPSGRE